MPTTPNKPAPAMPETSTEVAATGVVEVEKPVLYRPNVAAMILNSSDQLFVAERVSFSGAWQFPQGGVDPGEGLEEALLRELEEEIGVKPEMIQIMERRGGYRYDFPKGRLKFGIYGGQEQVYYLCRFHGKDKDININTKHREFGRWRWIKPEKFEISWVPKFKRDVYRRVFKDFFNFDK